jgi:hypothetical protein
MAKEKRDLRIVYLMVGFISFLILMFTVIIFIAGHFVNQPVEVSGNIECNSGNIGIDYKSVYNSTVSFNNYTKQYEGDFIPKILNLNGINNLNCKISFNAKGSASDLLNIISERNDYNG